MDEHEVELPDPPPPIPKPPLLRPLLVSVTLMVACYSLYFTGTTREAFFFAGVLSTLAGMNWMSYRMDVRHWKQLQAELDKLYEDVKVRARMLPKLLDRHGPDGTLSIMNLAEDLVKDGDFADIKQAVAAIERHHDLDPTDLDD